ncbi:hypothetical protein [Nocardioides aurantiacus]|uniref:Uncharacterized protein n=1 Tax=Nocardioides aurantiacus TaxID=86796 RepID=A0A3N2CWC0_9ACTN|nr:hypothetical protein [Nocardioides aurantiacus]ROR91783.1 hypothetical protein EDD33_2658 [Nocardioides aurantiacus]
MTAINVPARVRFWLYIVGAVAAPLVTYLFAEGIFNAAAVALATAYISLLNALAAAKTDLSEPNTRPVHPVEPDGH